MFESLTDRLEGVFSRLRGRGRLSEADVDAALLDIRAALIEADVNVRVVRELVSDIRERCVGAELSRSLSPGQQVVKAVHAALVEALGGEGLRISYASPPPTVVLLAGLQGSGKTTTAAKLARWFKSEGRNPLLVGADLERPAAIDQLRVLGEQAGVPVFSEPTDPVSVAVSSIKEAARLGRDVVVVDTAGRLAVDQELMDEVSRIERAISPRYTFFVVDAMTGQDAAATAEAFAAALSLDGVILTKLDGDARGGAALSVKGVVGKPIAFAATGEKLGDFDLFHPERMADRILGMGDVMTLIEQAEREMDQEVAARSAARMLEGRFTLEDFLAQLQQVKKLGSLSGILSLLPGVPKDLRQQGAALDDSQVARVEAIIRSMTPDERRQPEIVDGSRRARIAAGSGTTIQQVNQLLKQFREAQQLMRNPGMLGGMLGGLSPMRSGRMAGALADALSSGDLDDGAGWPGLGAGGLKDLEVGARRGAGLASGEASSAGGLGGSSRASPAAKGKKRKKGGRVTPKSRGR